MNGLDDLPPELDQLAAHHLHQRGIELTPDDAHKTGREAFATLRTEMRKRGYELPYSDAEMLQQMQVAFALAAFPTTAEEVEWAEKEWEDAEPIDIPQEEFDRILARLQTEIAKDNPKLWCVIGSNNEVIRRFSSQGDAEFSCWERNERARRWKLTATYSVQQLPFQSIR